jgi:hypothetical protein
VEIGQGSKMSQELLVFAFHDDTLYIFEKAERFTASHFGGPPPRKISGQSFGPKPLHLIASLGCLHIPTLSKCYLSSLPLIYGMQYDGCVLSYRVEAPHEVELLEMKPATSLDDWPYANFPPLVPYIPLRLDDTPQRVGYDEFAERFPNMPEKQSAELVVAVPPPATIGLSFWDSGDWDGATIVFECDLKKKEIKAYNVTS